jgi:hypothetical protein
MRKFNQYFLFQAIYLRKMRNGFLDMQQNNFLYLAIN